MIEGIGNASGTSTRDEDGVATIVRERRTEIERSNAVVVPRLTLVWQVVDHHELAGRVNGVSSEIYGRTVETVPCGQSRI